MMKKTLIVLGVIAAVALVSGAVFAYGKGWNGSGFGCRGFGNGPMMRSLDLTDDQQQKMFALSQEFRQKMFDSRNDPSKFSALREEHRKAVESILTDEQKKKFDEYRGNSPRGSGYGRCGRGRW